MITEVRLDYFKCFRTLRLPLRALTLLTGQNASGKSTVIQALTLLHQTAVDTSWGDRLLLDGSVISLGTLGDVVDKVNGKRRFAIGLAIDDREEELGLAWAFEGDASDRREIAVRLDSFELTDKSGSHTYPRDVAGGILPKHLPVYPWRDMLKSIIEEMTYLSAERIGPRETYPLRDRQQHRTVGARGELAPGKLYWFQDATVLESLRVAREGVPSLYKQTRAWLDDFFPGAAFDAQRIPGANLVTLGIRTSEDTDFHRPQHVGFGITHILPILIACLNARPGQLIVVENPEVHLHPAGQARMGHFLARAASAGVQLIVETHSDHVLNGIRRAVRENVLAAGAVALHFFQPRAWAETRGQAQVLSPQIDPEGNVDNWPEGFFDQFEKDMSYLAGLGE